MTQHLQTDFANAVDAAPEVVWEIVPLSLSVIAIATWMGIGGTENLARVAIGAWDGVLGVGDVLILLVVTSAWIVVATVLPSRFFRWEPRR